MKSERTNYLSSNVSLMNNLGKDLLILHETSSNLSSLEALVILYHYNLEDLE